MPPSVTYSASSVISVEVPISTNQLMTGTQTYSESLPDYLGGELDYLNSGGFHGTVAAKLSTSSAPDLAVTRSGKSDLFSVKATADSLEGARRVVDTAVAVYLDHLRHDNNSRYSSALAAIDAIASRIEANAVGEGVAAPTPDLVALHTARAALQVQLERAPGVVVVEPTSDGGSTASPPYGTIGGGVLGALLALGAALVWRSRSGILTSRKQVGDGLAPCPVIPRRKSGVDDTIARSLYAVMPRPRTGRIVVVGASGNSETRTVADYVSFAAAEHGPVKNVDLAGGATDSVTTEAVEDTVVVDAGAWASSAAVTDAVDDASQIIIVARIGFDTSQSVAELCQAMSSRSAPLCVVCVKG